MKMIRKKNIHAIASQVEKNGNDLNGDSYYYYNCDQYFVCIVADGLGSGYYANESSLAAINVVKEHHHEDVETLMKYCNEALQNKRGAAVAIMKIYFEEARIDYSCVGNIRFLMHSTSGKITYPVPMHGYLSGKPQKIYIQSFPYESPCKFLIYTDGLLINSGKPFLTKTVPIQYVAIELSERMNLSHIDDATFIIGTIFE